MGEWVNVTDYFSEGQRHYMDTYLEISEVLDDTIETSIFSSESGPYEIYFCFGMMHGIVYAEADKAYEIREKMKADLEEEYRKNKKPSTEFIDSFAVKYKVSLPGNIFFNSEAIFEAFGKLGDLRDDDFDDFDF